MKVAVFGNSVEPGFVPALRQFFEHLGNSRVDVCMYRPFYDFLVKEMNYAPLCSGWFHSHLDFCSEASYIFSIGGDGTFLQSFLKIRNFEIPVIGINCGRLGFLADISEGQLTTGLSSILEGKYSVIERSLLKVILHGVPGFEFNYALNEMTVSKTDTSSMITISVWINGEYLNSFWADGMIVATPTGSTAYSLSVGGPILSPDSANFVITPIAPHNLTVRPVVVPNDSELFMKVEGRGNQFLTSLDSRSVNVDLSTTITVRKAEFSLKTLHLPGQSFFYTLRHKLMWGADRRN